MTPSPDSTQPIEWLCACLTIPTHLFDPSNQAEPLQSLVWMIPDGPVLGSLTLDPGQAPRDVIVEHLRETTHNPLVGEPHQPERIRVASEELAEVLRHSVNPHIEIVCAPTPEFDALLEGMNEFVQQRQPEEPSYLSNGITSELMAAFFRAAASLYAAQPWNRVPADVPLLVDVEALSLEAAAVVVMGHGNREFGFLLFASESDFAGFLSAAKAARPSSRAPMPLFALDYSRGADMPLALRKEATAHGWQVANANAYPTLTVFGDQFAERSPTPQQLHQAEAISLALAEFTRSRDAAKGTDVSAPETAELTVQTHVSPITVRLVLASVPSAQQNARPRSTWKKKRRS